MKILLFVSFMFSSAQILAAQETDNPQPGAAEKAAVQYSEFHQLAEQWKEAYNSKEAKNLVPLYAANARYVSSHVAGYEAIGRDAVIANFQQGMTHGGYIDSIKILSIEISCDMTAMVTSYYATNSGVKVNGRNLLISKKINGRWLIVTHTTVVKD